MVTDGHCTLSVPQSPPVGFTLLVFYGFWFGYMFVLRSGHPENAEHQPPDHYALSGK